MGPWIVVVVEPDMQWPTVEVPHDLRRLRGNRMRERRHTGAPLPLTTRHMSRADTQHATTTAVRATGPATIRSSRPQRPATARSRQETSVQPRNHGPGLRITRAYRGNGAHRILGGRHAGLGAQPDTAGKLSDQEAAPSGSGSEQRTRKPTRGRLGHAAGSHPTANPDWPTAAARIGNLWTTACP